MKRLGIRTIGNTTYIEMWIARTLHCVSVTRWRRIRFTRSYIGETLAE